MQRSWNFDKLLESISVGKRCEVQLRKLNLHFHRWHEEPGKKGEPTTAQTMVSLSLTFITVVGSTWLWPFYYLYLDHNFNPPTPADVIIMGFLFYLVTFFLADLVSVRQLWYTDQRHHVIIHSNPSVTSFEFLSPKINIITLLFFSSRILSEINKPNSIFNSSRKTKMQTTSTDLFTMIRWRFQNLDNI